MQLIKDDNIFLKSVFAEKITSFTTFEYFEVFINTQVPSEGRIVDTIEVQHCMEKSHKFRINCEQIILSNSKDSLFLCHCFHMSENSWSNIVCSAALVDLI